MRGLHPNRDGVVAGPRIDDADRLAVRFSAPFTCRRAERVPPEQVNLLRRETPAGQALRSERVARRRRQPRGLELVPPQGRCRPLWDVELGVDLGGRLFEQQATIAVRGAAPDAGPVGHWKLDEGQGTDIADSSEHGNHGTVDSPTWVEGKVGTALEFDGTGVATVPTSESLDLADEVTVAFWLKLGPATGDWQFPIGKYQNDPLQRNYGIYIHKDTLEPCFSASFEDGSYLHTDIRSNTPLDDGEWHHVAATYSMFEKRVRVYVDGRPVIDSGLSEGAMLLAEEPLRLGVGTVGAIDEVMVWPRALDEFELEALAR